MKNKIYCSTGTIVGRDNRWNHRLFIDHGDKIEADGFELMMVKAYYEKLETVIADCRASGLPFPTIHAEKDIGLYLGGEEADRQEALRLFARNCHAGEAIGAKKLILHLWSGQNSDCHLERNLSLLGTLFDMASRHGLSLLCENVPCVKHDPLFNLNRVHTLFPEARFVYDVRFGAFHEQNDAIVASEALTNGLVDHIHLSDYVGPPHDWSSLRPILHLGEGIIGLDTLLPRIAARYHGTITLESPEILADRCAVEVINRDLAYIRRFFVAD